MYIHVNVAPWVAHRQLVKSENLTASYMHALCAMIGENCHCCANATHSGTFPHTTPHKIYTYAIQSLNVFSTFATLNLKV